MIFISSGKLLKNQMNKNIYILYIFFSENELWVLIKKTVSEIYHFIITFIDAYIYNKIIIADITELQCK